MMLVYLSFANKLPESQGFISDADRLGVAEATNGLGILSGSISRVVYCVA